MAGGSGSTFIRVCYLIIPFILTLISTALLLVSFLNQTSSGLNNLYYLRLNTSDISLASTLSSEIQKALPDGVGTAVPSDITAAASAAANLGGNVGSEISSAAGELPSNVASEISNLRRGVPATKVVRDVAPTDIAAAAASQLASGSIPGIAAYYDIGLWNYCSAEDKTKGPNFCSPKKSGGYVFDPLDVWGISIDDIQDIVPKDWDKSINTYKSATHWLFIAYIISLVSSAVTIILGLLSFCLHRVSSVITSISASITALLVGATAGTATAIYVILMGIVSEKLDRYGVHTSLGTRLYVITWLAAALAILASLLWTCGCCCGGGRRNKREDFGGRGRSTGPGWGNGSEAYQRLPSPSKEGAEHLLRPEYGSGNSYSGGGYPMQPWQQSGQNHQRSASVGYEPYRSGRGIHDTGDLGA
ncbi:MAG: hypothetical protein M1828_001559 [Chrysothrix sp. TS-e1954]|nr:MAG: hypothetical protein M1828_001559 [Chrysothrix sp. TS-e1954]